MDESPPDDLSAAAGALEVPSSGEPSLPPPATRAIIPPMPTERQRRSVRPVSAPLDPQSGFRAYADHVVAEPEALSPGVEAAPHALPADLASASARAAVRSMPASSAEISLFNKVWFVLAFVLPVVLGSIYYLAIAPNQYVTEFRFSVREPVSQPANASSAGALAALFGGNPTPGSDMLDNYTVVDYVRSEQAARDLDARLNLHRMFSRPWDPIARLRSSAPIERLVHYWQGMVYSDYDPASGLAVVRVHAFSPADSYAIATTLQSLSADLVNQIGVKSQQDSLRYAQAEVDRANEQVTELRARLGGVRRQVGAVDPDSSIVAGNAQLATTLRGNLAQLESQIAFLSKQLQNPQAPQIKVLRQQLAATRQQLETTGAQVTGGPSSLASSVGKFEDANTQLQNASAVLLANITGLSQAQASADSQRLYMTTYARPNMPESSIYPNRKVAILLVVLVAGMIWMIGMLLANSVLEHGK